MDPLEAVKLYVGFAGTALNAHDHELAEKLMGSGLSRDAAERVVAFVPVAFGRQLLSSSEAPLSDTYEIDGGDTGRRVRGAFATEPLYRAAVRYPAEHPEDEGRDSDRRAKRRSGRRPEASS